jgi:hypothetical protein
MPTELPPLCRFSRMKQTICKGDGGMWEIVEMKKGELKPLTIHSDANTSLFLSPDLRHLPS